MKSKPTGPGESIIASQYNSSRDDSRASGYLLAHQQLGALAIPTNPTNGQTITITINSVNFIVITYVSALGSTANSVFIQGTAALTAAATVNFLRRPDLNTTNQVAAHATNQELLQYVGWSLPSGGTTLTPFSLNKNVNGTNAPLTNFTVSTAVTGASWTAQTMELYVEDGVYYIGNTRVIFLGASTPTFTAPVSNPRIDLVTADSSGTIAVVTGTESGSPTAPSYPSNKIVLCEVMHVVGETALYDLENQQSGEGYILNDVRPVFGGAYISSTSQVASGLFIPDPGSEAQGDILYYNGSNWVLLAPGSAGQVLKTQGAGANPVWASVGQRTLLQGTGAGNYTTTSNGTFVDVDATNLVATLAVSNNQILTIAYSLNFEGVGTPGIVFWQLIETNSGVVVASNSTSNTTMTTYQGLLQFACKGTSAIFRLQFKTNSGTFTATMSNSSSAGQFNLPSILIYA
jgi:hypothetical protein